MPKFKVEYKKEMIIEAKNEEEAEEIFCTDLIDDIRNADIADDIWTDAVQEVEELCPDCSGTQMIQKNSAYLSCPECGKDMPIYWRHLLPKPEKKQ